MYGKKSFLTKGNQVRSEKENRIMHIILIIFICFSIYGNSLNNAFVWDDIALIRDNAYIKDCSRAGGFFAGHMSSIEKSDFYRPLVMISYAIDYSIWKLNTMGYHLTNILLHCLTALAVYWLVAILYGNSFIALLTGIFFAVHPVHTEAVTYISGRSDCLAGFLMVLSFIFYVKNLQKRKMKFYIFMILAYAGGVLSREAALALPLLLLIYNYTFGRELKFKEITPFLIVSFIYASLRLIILGHLAFTADFLQRLPGFFAAIAGYIKLLVFPFYLHMVDSKIELFSLNDPKVIAGILITAFLLIYAFKNRKNHSPVFFSISWFLLALLPVSNIYPLNAYMREHWLYVPSIGFFLLLASGLSSLCARKKFYVAGIVFIIGLSGFYSYLTIKQNEYWKEPIGFYKRTLEYDPDNWRLLLNLGNAYNETGKIEEAEASYKKALGINPKSAEAYHNLGIIYNNMGRKEEAMAAFHKALDINPKDSITCLCLSRAYFYKKEYDLAVEYCYKAIDLGFNVPPEFLEMLKLEKK